MCAEVTGRWKGWQGHLHNHIDDITHRPKDHFRDNDNARKKIMNHIEDIEVPHPSSPGAWPNKADAQAHTHRTWSGLPGDLRGGFQKAFVRGLAFLRPGSGPGRRADGVWKGAKKSWQKKFTSPKCLSAQLMAMVLVERLIPLVQRLIQTSGMEWQRLENK